MKRIIVFYNFIIVSVIVVLGILSTQNILQLLIASLFSPMLIYFWVLLFPRQTEAIETTNDEVGPILEGTEIPAEEAPIDFDSTKRTFLKLIGSAGASVFIYFLFTQRAEGAFFGSVPGPGTVAIKDSTGVKIDPSEKHPTDGYRISELDDASTPSYYGFTNKTGEWFIMKEDSSGAYRYVKGTTSFSTNWTNRASLVYDYYHNVF